MEVRQIMDFMHQRNFNLVEQVYAEFQFFQAVFLN